MAKALGAKSRLIREAITKHPDMGNKTLAEMLNDADERMDDKIKVTANDVAQQKQAMKKAGVPAPAAPAEAKKRGRPKGSVNAPRATAPPAAPPPTAASPVDLIDKVF